jgi:hypothetical protein
LIATRNFEEKIKNGLTCSESLILRLKRTQFRPGIRLLPKPDDYSDQKVLTSTKSLILRLKKLSFDQEFDCRPKQMFNFR